MVQSSVDSQTTREFRIMIDRVAIIDCDPIVHIIAYAQWTAGNRGDQETVENHVRRFVTTVVTVTIIIHHSLYKVDITFCHPLS